MIELRSIRAAVSALAVCAALLSCGSRVGAAQTSVAAAADPFQYRATLGEIDRVVAKHTAETTQASVRIYTLTYDYSGGGTVPAVLIEPLSATTEHPAPVLMLVHGLGMRKEMMEPIARIAAQTGYASLMIDLPGFGERAPATPVGAFTATIQLTSYISGLLSRSVLDLGAGIDYLTTRPELDSTRIGVIGVSLGGIIAADWAGVEPRIKCVALVSAGGGLGDILDFQAKQHTSFGEQFASVIQSSSASELDQALRSVDPVSYIGNISPRPLLMENGDADTIIPPSAARTLYNAAKEPKHIDWYPGEGHIPSMLELYTALTAFLSQNLPVNTPVKTP